MNYTHVHYGFLRDMKQLRGKRLQEADVRLVLAVKLTDCDYLNNDRWSLYISERSLKG